MPQFTECINALALTASMALAVACENEVTNPTVQTATSNLSSSNELRPQSLSAKPSVLSICHRTEGTNGYILITVSERAAPAHVAHGDGAVGDRVPNLPDMVFDAHCAPAPARLAFSFADPSGDHLQLTPIRQLNPPPGVIDLVGLNFTFDVTTGDYEIIVSASVATPFVGGFRINVLLFNPDVGTTAQDPAYFDDSSNDFFLFTPITSVTLTGSDPKLLAWEVGDRVAPCQGASFEELGPCQGGLGLPDGVGGFTTGVYTFTGPPPFGLPKGLDVFHAAPAAVIGD